MENPSKSTHLGTLLRCAAAFNCHQVLLVGYDKFNCQGSFGSHLYLDIVVFPTWDSVYEYLRNGGGENENENTEAVASTDDSIQSTNEQNETTTSHQNNNNPVTILGILGAYGGEETFSSNGVQVYEGDDSYASIVPPSPNKKQDTCIQHRSFPIDKRLFTADRDTCFILSRYKNEFPASQARICNGFVHVPHLSLDVKETISKSNLMDTATILSITLHHYTAFAGYEERTFAENQKFVKEIKGNSLRRRLCRVYDQDKQLKQNVVTDSAEIEPESNDTDGQEVKGAMMLFESPDAEASDY